MNDKQLTMNNYTN